MSQPRRLVTLRAAAEHLGCGYSTIQRRVADGSIPVARIGKTRRVDLDALDALTGGPASAPDPREPYADFIVKLVDAAPSLTGEQRVRIAAILGGGR